jgi:hypothetical protein
MFRDDYILRLIKQMAEFIARIARRREEEKLDEALREADGAWAELFDIPREISDALDSPTLAGMLRHPERMRVAALLFWEEGRVYAAKGDPLTAAARYRRAFELILEARALDPTEADDSAVLELARLVPASELDPRYRSGQD